MLFISKPINKKVALVIVGAVIIFFIYIIMTIKAHDDEIRKTKGEQVKVLTLYENLTEDHRQIFLDGAKKYLSTPDNRKYGYKIRRMWIDRIGQGLQEGVLSTEEVKSVLPFCLPEEVNEFEIRFKDREKELK